MEPLPDLQEIRRALGLLPNTLPVTVVAVTGEAPALSDADRCQVHFVVRGGDAATAPALLDLTLPLAAVAGERVTLSYIPATVDDPDRLAELLMVSDPKAYLTKHEG